MLSPLPFSWLFDDCCLSYVADKNPLRPLETGPKGESKSDATAKLQYIFQINPIHSCVFSYLCLKKIKKLGVADMAAEDEKYKWDLFVGGPIKHIYIPAVFLVVTFAFLVVTKFFLVVTEIHLAFT